MPIWCGLRYGRFRWRLSRHVRLGKVDQADMARHALILGLVAEVRENPGGHLFELVSCRHPMGHDEVV